MWQGDIESKVSNTPSDTVTTFKVASFYTQDFPWDIVHWISWCWAKPPQADLDLELQDPYVLALREASSRYIIRQLEPLCNLLVPYHARVCALLSSLSDFLSPYYCGDWIELRDDRVIPNIRYSESLLTMWTERIWELLLLSNVLWPLGLISVDWANPIRCRTLVSYDVTMFSANSVRLFLAMVRTNHVKVAGYWYGMCFPAFRT